MQNKELQETVGRHVKRLRKRGNFSRERLARAAGISSASIHHIEKAVANPTLGVLDRLAGALGVKVETLVKP